MAKYDMNMSWEDFLIYSRKRLPFALNEGGKNIDATLFNNTAKTE